MQQSPIPFEFLRVAELGQSVLILGPRRFHWKKGFCSFTTISKSEVRAISRLLIEEPRLESTMFISTIVFAFAISLELAVLGPYL